MASPFFSVRVSIQITDRSPKTGFVDTHMQCILLLLIAWIASKKAVSGAKKFLRDICVSIHVSIRISILIGILLKSY